MGGITRRDFLGGAGAALGVVAVATTVGAGPAAASPGKPGRPAREEARSLDELYAAALAEGGKLTIYAGGDTADQVEPTRQAFLAQFPGIDLTMVVDYSKYHDVRVDNQLATGTLVPDLVQFQTLHDFTRWKAAGVLLPYKPVGFSAVHPTFKDPDGAWVAIFVVAFSYMYAAALGSDGPATPLDLVDPRWKDQISSSYPHDDDAVLYLFSLYVQRYGWDWARKFAAQNPAFGRGAQTPIGAVASGQKAVGVGSAGSLLFPLAPGVQWAIPAGHPFMAWGQRAAILRGAAHPEAARLYLSWQLSRPVQETAFTGWSVRTDVTPPAGLAPIWAIPDANLEGFAKFMADRAVAERWRQTFALYFGEVQGPPSPGVLGLHPGA